MVRHRYRIIANQFIKAVSNQHFQENRKQLAALQIAELRLQNPESMITTGKVLRTQTFVKLEETSANFGSEIPDTQIPNSLKSM